MKNRRSHVASTATVGLPNRPMGPRCLSNDVSRTAERASGAASQWQRQPVRGRFRPAFGSFHREAPLEVWQFRNWVVQLAKFPCLVSGRQVRG